MRLKSDAILHIYFEYFIQSVEYLVHRGLVKKYRYQETNTTTLKGQLNFAKQLQHNLIHQERFYVRHTTYDTTHLLHNILYQCLQLIKSLLTSTDLLRRLNALLHIFPEFPSIKVNKTLFERIKLNRKRPRRNSGIPS